MNEHTCALLYTKVSRYSAFYYIILLNDPVKVGHLVLGYFITVVSRLLCNGTSFVFLTLSWMTFIGYLLTNKLREQLG